MKVTDNDVKIYFNAHIDEILKATIRKELGYDTSIIAKYIKFRQVEYDFFGDVPDDINITVQITGINYKYFSIYLCAMSDVLLCSRKLKIKSLDENN